MQIKYLIKHPEIDLVGTNIIFINDSGELIGKNTRLPSDLKEIKKILKYTNVFKHPTWMMRKELFVNLNGYRDLSSAQDYDFICRVFINGYKATNMNNYLLFYRIRENSISNSKYIEQKINFNYSNKIYKSYLKGKKLEFNYEELNNIIINGRKSEKNFLKSNRVFVKALEFKKNNKLIRYYFFLILSALMSKYRLFSLIETLRSKLRYI